MMMRVVTSPFFRFTLWLLVAGMVTCLGCFPSQELLKQMPEKNEHLWVLERARGKEFAAWGQVPTSGIMSPNGLWYAMRPGRGSYSSEGPITLGSVESGDEILIPKESDDRIPHTDGVWSPDSRYVAYVSRQGLKAQGVSAVLLYDLQQGESKELFRQKGDIRQLRFWDGGTNLLYILESPDGVAQHMLCGVSEQSLQPFGEPLPVDHATRALQSPKRKHIAYSYRRHLFVYDVEKRTGKRVLEDTPTFSMVWSPDGRYLLAAISVPSRNPFHRLISIVVHFGYFMKHYHVLWAYDTQTGEATTMKMTGRIREALILWPR